MFLGWSQQIAMTAPGRESPGSGAAFGQQA